MTKKEAYDITVNALRKSGVTSDEILDIFSCLFDCEYYQTTIINKIKKLKDLLLKAGIPRSLNGYNYLFEAILMYSGAKNITTFIYPRVAEKFHTTPYRVERAIRYAIEKGMNNICADDMYTLFGNTINFYKAKPSNTEFIALCAEWLNS